jgi:RNA polymerase sigma factor (sigma-70 family)
MNRGTVPVTSATLVEGLAESRDASWRRFAALYRPMMIAFVAGKFPGADADEAIQETLLALVDAMPNYRYSPREKGAFHSFITRILEKRAQDGLRKRWRRYARDMKYVDRLVDEGRVFIASEYSSEDGEDTGAQLILATDDRRTGQKDREWRDALFTLALRELDGATANRVHWQIFRRCVLGGEQAAEVSESLMVGRDMVYQTAKRMKERLKGIVQKLLAVGAA